jgi:hypothetical protein
MDKIRLSGLAALTVAFGLGACSHTTLESPAPSASTGATVTTTTTASADTTAAKRDSAAGYQASGNAATTTSTTSTTVTTPSTSATATTTVPPAASTTVTTTVPQATTNGAQTLVFTPVNNSGFSGNVVLTDMGDHTQVAVTLNSPANSDAGADHNVAIHTGTCASPGATVKGLSDVEGNGKASNNDVDMRLGQLTDGQHIIVANENPGDRAVVCVAIPSR